MFCSLWIRKLLGWPARRERRRQASQKRRFVRPRLEGLEDRITPSGAGTTVSAANATQLSAAFTAANTAQTAYTINLTGSSTDYNFSAIGAQLIDADQAGITIVGSGQTLTAAANNRLFQVNSEASLSLKDVILTGGNVNSTGFEGGAIRDACGNLSLDTVTITGNAVHGSSKAEGGGVFVSGGGSLSLLNSHIDGNQAIGSTAKGGNGNAYGGGVYVSGGGSVKVTASTFNNDLARGGNGKSSGGGNAFGGALYIAGSSTVTIAGSTFTGDRAQGGSPTHEGTASGGNAAGGGIYVSGSGWNLTLSNSTNFSNNIAAGGIGASGSSGKHGGTGGYALGGGAYLEGSGTANITSTSFSVNQALGGAGGSGGVNGGKGGDGYYAEGGGAYLNVTGTLNISESGFNANVALGGSGGQGGGGRAGATGGNGGFASGGGAYLFADSGTILNSSFAHNRAVGGSGGQGGTGSSSDGGKGGKGGYGKAAYGGGAYLTFAANLTNTTVDDNSATGGNAGPGGLGGKGANGSAGTAAAAYGGGLYGNSAWTLTNDTIALNKAAAGTGGATTVTAQGGGIYNFHYPILTNVILEGNTAASGPDYFGDIATSVGGVQVGGFDLIGNTSGIFNISGVKTLPGMRLNIPMPQLDTTQSTATPVANPLTPTNGLVSYAPLPKSLSTDAGSNSVLSAIASTEGVSVSNTTDESNNASADAGAGIIDIGAQTGTPTPTVQGMGSTDGGKTFSSISGAASNTLLLASISTALNDNAYEAVFSNSAGTATTPASLLTDYPSSSPRPSPSASLSPSSAPTQLQAAMTIAIDMATFLLQGNVAGLAQLALIDQVILAQTLPPVNDMLAQILADIPYAGSLSTTASPVGINYANALK